MTWTDERIDDLSKRMEDGFARIDRDIGALRTEMNGDIGALRTDMNGSSDALRSEMSGGFFALNERLDRLYNVLLVTAGAVVVAFVGPQIF